ncbi:MAG: hypothetical protein II547_00010, partial [Treponema sp.]|nr:hypothetical protein [Treponema sp.]
TKFISDATAPVLTVTNLSDNGSIRETDRNADGSYTLRGTWSDAGSGTYGLEWSLNGTSFTPVSESDAPKTTGTANWAVTIPSGSLTAGTGRAIYLKATDNAGNPAVLNLTGITCDYSDPSISISTSVGAYYPYSASPLNVSVLASDDVGLSGITVVSAKKNGVSVSEGSGSYTFTPSGSGTSMTGTVSIPRNMTADGAWEITVRATDSLNRQKEASFSTTIDGSKPVVDVSGATAEGTLVGTASDKWFKNTTIRVGASATDTGYSGLETIYYKVVEDGTAVSDLTADSSDGQAAVSGNDATFSITASLASSSNWVYLQAVDKAGNKSDMKKVVINVDMDMPSLQSKYYTYNGANFQPATGSIRTNGANDLTVYGNINDSKSGVKEVKFFRTPEGGSTAENLVATMTYSSTAITDESHIPTDYAATISDPKSVRSFKAVISSSKLSTGSVKAESSDIAGNVSSQFVFSLIEDKTPPAIVLKNPGTKKIQVNGETPAPEDSTNVASLNGTVTISGSASDDALAAVEVFYKVGDASATQYIPCGTFTGSAAYNWSTDELVMSDEPVMSSVSGGSVTMLGTTAGTTVPYTGDTENVYIKVIAHDSADNTTEHIYKYVIDPESDRPEIRLTNVSLTNAMSSTNRISHTSKTIYGNVSDDDGSVSKLEYSYTGADNSWTEVSVTGGSWTLDIDTDGDKEIYFRVTDANGSVFTSTASGTQYTCPKLTAGTGDSGISVLYLNVDTAKPEVSDIGFQTGSTNASWGSTYDDAFATAKFGGPRYRYARFRAKAEDTNGIESVMFKIGNAEVTGNKQGSTNYYTADFDLSTFNTTTSTQSHTLTVSASDVAGGVTELTRTFSIDNDLPVPTGSVPGIVDSATSVNGKINELGTTTYFSVTVDEGTRPADNLILNGTGYAVGGWLPVSGTSTSLTFTIWFDDNPSPSDGLTHTQLFSQYLAELGITPNEETQANEFVNLHLMSIDECGNVGYGSIRIEVDPFGDKPTVSISQPSNGATLGGDIIVAGTAIDTVGTEGNIGVFGVGIKMDVNNDGKWTGADIQDILGRTQNFAWCRYDGTTLVDVDTANLPESSASEDDCRTYAIKADMTGSSSWTFMINDGFTPENADALPIALGAFAVDKDGKTSPIDFSRMSRRSFTIDSAAPKMDGEMLYKRKADGSSDQNNFSEYTEGKSIRKEWVFEADIYDDNGIRRISVDGVDIVSDGNPVTTVSEDVASVGDLDGHSGYSGFHIRIPVGRDDN